MRFWRRFKRRCELYFDLIDALSIYIRHARELRKEETRKENFRLARSMMRVSRIMRRENQ